MAQGARICDLALAAVAILGITACHRGDTRAADLKALRSTDAALSQAVADKDLEQTLEFYANDASILPVAEPIVTGRQAIRGEWEHIFAIPGIRSTSGLAAMLAFRRLGRTVALAEPRVAEGVR